MRNLNKKREIIQQKLIHSKLQYKEVRINFHNRISSHAFFGPMTGYHQKIDKKTEI